jgi:hypothetical protein
LKDEYENDQIFHDKLNEIQQKVFHKKMNQVNSKVEPNNEFVKNNNNESNSHKFNKNFDYYSYKQFQRRKINEKFEWNSSLQQQT